MRAQRLFFVVLMTVVPASLGEPVTIDQIQKRDLREQDLTMRSNRRVRTPFPRHAQMTTVFGPKQYTRSTMAPHVFTDTFTHCGTQPCQIVVVNGNSDGSNRVSSASILLNGIQVVGPADFNQRVSVIEKPVTLAAENELTVRLASKPGSFVTVEVQCLASPVVLSAVAPGVSLTDPTTLLSAVSIANTGTATAENVLVSSITLNSGTLTSPSSLPVSLGMIPVGGFAVLNADFTGGPFVPGATYALTVKGTYAVGTATYCFELTTNLVIPPAAPGSADLISVSVAPRSVSGGGFPHQPLNFGDEVNKLRWTVPTAPFVAGTPTTTGTLAQKAPLGDPGTVTFVTNNGLGLTSGGFNGTTSNIAEPSGGASAAGVVFASANWDAAFSTNGSTFTQLDPTTIFNTPNDPVGFCCDQIVQYVPSVNLFIWFLQGNGYRLAVASPSEVTSSGGTAWTYWNLTPQLFGQPNGTGFDYPDLSVGDNELYMSWDAGFGCPPGCNGGHQVARTSLAGLQARGTITIEFTDPANGGPSWGAKLVQDTGNEIFWAGPNNNHEIRVFSLAEGSNTYFWRDIGISTWANNALSSMTPDGMNWLVGSGGFPGNAIIGGTRSGSQVWFAWTAGTDSNFPQAHIEMVTLDRGNNFNPIQQVQVWNPSYAFAYPALATNGCTGEVGLSFEFGGGGNYENHVVGFWGDFIAYITSGSNVGTTRFGDYVTIRQQPGTVDNPGNLFDAFGYGLNSVPPPGSGTTTDLRYVAFGRPASSCVTLQ